MVVAYTIVSETPFPPASAHAKYDILDEHNPVNKWSTGSLESGAYVIVVLVPVAVKYHHASSLSVLLHPDAEFQ